MLKKQKHLRLITVNQSNLPTIKYKWHGLTELTETTLQNEYLVVLDEFVGLTILH
jgi:hypothetical protein